jgi:hypothetical protein
MQDAETETTAPSERLPLEPRAIGLDAELIALCAQHIINRNTYNDEGGYLEPEEDPLWEAYCQTHDAIGSAHPQTIEGALAKARAAKAEALRQDGTELPEDGPAGRWAWQVVDDLLRLSGMDRRERSHH